MAVDTNALEYWLNWRVFTCEMEVLLAIFAAFLLIWRYEGPTSERHNREIQQKRAGTVYSDESWRPCLKRIHPAWLLAFRIFAFLIFWTMFIISFIISLFQRIPDVFYAYTEWTLILVTTYFGLASALSIRGCYEFMNKRNNVIVNQMKMDEEQVSNDEEHNPSKLAGIWGYTVQIIYQTSAGAAMFTDVVFWSIIYPSSIFRGFQGTLGAIFLHSLNLIFLLGDATLNGMRFPLFRISYSVLFTAIYIIFQWILHACISLRWPYSFLDLSPSYAPLSHISF